MLPLSALERAGSEIANYRGSGMSVMEMSHRSKVFLRIFEETQEKLRRLMRVPDGYRVLLLQTGASGQFSMIPLNLMGRTGKADYAVTGNFSSIAMKEAKKYGMVNIAADSGDRDHSYIPAQEQLKLDPEASYFYYCANNTIYGTEWQYVPETGAVPLVCDMSSDILSRPVDLSKFGIVYAGAQKNMAPAGLTVVIIREDLAGHELPFTPLIMNYQTMIEKDSMYNTPPCWCIYMLGLTLDWVEEQGGVEGMEKLRTLRSSMLYDTLDSSRLFRCHFGRLQLTFPQALVLNVLGEEGPMPISVLAERTGSANSTVSGIVDRLEKLDLARRDRSGKDRRIIYVAVTDKYQALREKAEANVAGYFASVLSTMPPQDRDMVAQALLRLDEALLEPVVKTVALSILTRLTAEVCRSSGEGGLAAFVETAGTILALGAALPLARAVTALLAEMLT